MKIILINTWHNGDALFSQPIIKKFIALNSSYNHIFEIHIKSSLFIYKDIPNVTRLTNDTTYNLHVTPYKLDIDTLIINFWIASWWQIVPRKEPYIDECNLRYLDKTFKVIINHINQKHNLNLQFTEDTTINEIVLPYSNIEKFILYKNQHMKYFLFYYNYLAKSGQKVSFQNHDNILLQLATTFKNIIIVVPNLSSHLKNQVSNILDCSLMFDCQEDYQCENLTKLLYIASLCNLTVLYDIGACFYYCASLPNNDMNILHFGVSDFYYKKLILNRINKYNTRYICANNDNQVISSITQKITTDINKI
jgi:hypothetical protein